MNGDSGRAEQQPSVLLSLSSLLGAAVDVDRLLARLVDLIRQAMDADRATLFLVDRERDELDFAVNLDPRGSDLTRIDDAALPKSGSGAVTTGSANRHRVELWHAVAAGLLLLLLLESILIQR